jgi:hypothetical protein
MKMSNTMLKTQIVTIVRYCNRICNLGVTTVRAPNGALSLRGLLVLLFTSVFIATSTLALFFPGLVTADSATQWQWAIELTRNIGTHDAHIYTWYPPLMEFTMALSFWITGTVWAFSWCQYFIFVLSVLLLLTALLRDVRYALGAFCILLPLPPFWGMYTVIESTIWSAAGLSLILAGMLLSGILDLYARGIVLLLAALGAVILFGFRYNALPLLVPLVAFAFVVMPTRRKQLGMTAALLVAAVLSLSLQNLGGLVRFASAWPILKDALPHVVERDQVPTILVWEIVGTMKVLGGSAVETYAIPGLGDFNDAVMRHKWRWQGSLIWGDRPPLSLQAIEDNEERILTDWKRIVAEHPLAFAEAKFEIWRGLLGFGEKRYTGDEMIKVPASQMNNLSPDVRERLTLVDSLARRLGSALVDWELSFPNNPLISVLYVQWLSLVASLPCAVWLCRRLESRTAIAIWGAGVISYLPYFILTPSSATRYFFPSYTCFASLIAAVIFLALRRCFGEVCRFGFPSAVSNRWHSARKANGMLAGRSRYPKDRD